MNIEIIGAESLGVRGLSCFVQTKKRKILIDPGIALGYKRHGLLPHPFQVAIGEKIRKNILEKFSKTTDIIISHFHGDHVPLTNANPYQLNLKDLDKIDKNVKIWAKNQTHFSSVETERAKAISSVLNKNLIQAENKNEDIMEFSKAVFHGESENNSETVMMTRIQENGVFVHASDIQLFDKEAVSLILDWRPDIALIGGPPLYLEDRFSEDQFKKARENAELLAQKIDILILDHHLLRNREGFNWIKALSSKAKGKVLCGADFMKKSRMPLEADRGKLYKIMPVPEKWHEEYAQNKVNTDYYWDLGKMNYFPSF